jgi:SAM-dependent methyltransferase
VINCPLCNSEVKSIYKVHGIPLFQNKVYKSEQEARRAPVGDVELVHCKACDYIYNQQFDYSLMSYDETYQNEQANSNYFQTYLESVIDLIITKGFADKKIVEIGCGKGYFLNELWKKGIDAIGFDPAYEGDNDKIIKDYFSDKYKDIKADLIIIRHTLEHVQEPLKFLQAIGQAAGEECHVFIEVPSFEWIVEHSAFWDVFYEHCNYFTRPSLENMFSQSEHGLLFNKQYQYLLASFDDLQEVPCARGKGNSQVLSLAEKMEEYTEFIEQHDNIVVWGAGAKGSTFVNIMDCEAQKVKCVVDINPVKQGRFIGGSAHGIVSPEQLIATFDDAVVLIMNENYESEIKEILKNKNFNTYVLGE